MRMSEVIEQAAGVPAERVAVVSGPNLAREIAERQPTATTVASVDQASAQRLQDACTTVYFRPYSYFPATGDLNEAVANYWRAIGVTVSLEEVEVPRDRDIYSKFGYQSALTLDASGSNQWSGQTIWNSGYSHLGIGVENPKVDALLRQIATTVDTAKQEGMWRELGEEAFTSFMDVNMFWLPSEVMRENFAYFSDPVMVDIYNRMLKETDFNKARALMREYERRVTDEAHQLMVTWWYRIVPMRSYVKGWKISPSHYLHL